VDETVGWSGMVAGKVETPERDMQMEAEVEAERHLRERLAAVVVL